MYTKIATHASDKQMTPDLCENGIKLGHNNLHITHNILRQVFPNSLQRLSIVYLRISGLSSSTPSLLTFELDNFRLRKSPYHYKQLISRYMLFLSPTTFLYAKNFTLKL